MGLRDEQARGEAPGPLEVRGVEVGDRDRESRRVAADLVQRQQPQVAVERRVLDALGRDRRRGLLKPGDELVRDRGAAAQQQRAGELVVDVGALHGVDVSRRHQPAPRLDIGPVDRQRRQRTRQLLHGEARRQSLQALELAGERPLGLVELGLERDLGETTPVARHLLPECRERLLARRIDEQRGDVIEKLVAHCAGHRPVPQALGRQRRAEDLLDPDTLDPGLAQPPQVAGRIREPVRMVDAQSVEHAVAHELENLGVGDLEHLAIFLADRSELVDVEEAAIQAGLWVNVEEARTQIRVTPPAVLVRALHVVGDHVQHDAQAGVGELAQSQLAAEFGRHACRVDDVVAVGRARAGLQRRAEVDVTDAKITQVGHELANAREVEAPAELETVGGAQLHQPLIGHRSPRRRLSVRDSTGRV